MCLQRIVIMCRSVSDCWTNTQCGEIVAAQLPQPFDLTDEASCSEDPCDPCPLASTYTHSFISLALPFSCRCLSMSIFIAVHLVD